MQYFCFVSVDCLQMLIQVLAPKGCFVKFVIKDFHVAIRENVGKQFRLRSVLAREGERNVKLQSPSWLLGQPSLPSLPSDRRFKHGRRLEHHNHLPIAAPWAAQSAFEPGQWKRSASRAHKRFHVQFPAIGDRGVAPLA